MRKMQRFAEPGLRLCLLLMAAFAAVTWFFNEKLAYAEAGVVAALIVYAVIRNRTRQRELQAFVESVTYNAESATNNTLIHFPLPMAVFRLGDSGVVWANQPFWDMCGRSGPAFDARLDELVPDFSGKWLMEGKNRMADLMEIGERKFQVNGNMVRAGQSEETYEFMGITYWVDVTEYDRVREEYYNSRPVVMIILVDNYDEMMKPLTDRQRTELLGLLDGAVEKWCEGKGGILRRTDRDRYMFIFEKRYLDEITRDRFTLVESIHSLVSPTGIHATVSIGAGLDGAGYEEDYSFAALAEDMALSRGGDQAVVKNRYNFEFFGGRGTEVETRTKVRSRVTANSLSRLIGDASQVFVMSHKYADNDSVGFVVDTNRPEQVENDTLLTACASRLAVIDHHRRAATYIQNPTLSLYEPKASSACELVTEMMQELVEPSDILPAEADAVLAGIVLDTKNFTIRTVDRTFDAAAFLERAGADTSRVRELYKNGLEETLARYDLIRQAKVHRGIALVAARETQSRVLAAQTADELLNISGVEASAVLYPMEGGGVAISARSVGKVNVQVLLEQLGGGGNKSAAGAQIPDIDLREAFNRLCAAIDKYMDTE